MDDKDELSKTELKDAGLKMKLGEDLGDSKLSNLLPTVLGVQVEKERPQSVSGVSLAAAATKTSVLAQLSNPETRKDLFRKLTANKYVVAACIFVALQGALLLQTQEPGLYTFLGNQSGLGGERGKDAEANFKEALFLNPKSEAATAGLANLKFAVGDFDNAIKYAKQSLQIKPNAISYNILGIIYIAQNNLKDAAKVLETSGREFPDADTPKSQALLGWVKKQLGEDFESEKLYASALASKQVGDVAVDYHHMGYNSNEGVNGFPKNAYLAVAFEDIALAMHIEKVDPLRRLYAYTNKARAYNDLYEPQKALANLHIVMNEAKSNPNLGYAYVNLKQSDRLVGDYKSLLRDANAEAKFNSWDENSYDLAEVSFFAKDYKAALKYANNVLENYGDEDAPWALLIKNESLLALHKKIDLSASKKSFQKYLKSEIETLRKHDLNKRANDLQLWLNPLDKSR